MPLIEIFVFLHYESNPIYLRCFPRLHQLAPVLIKNETSNLAESYMSLRGKMDGAKYTNNISSGSFQTRSVAAGLNMSLKERLMSSGWSKEK